MTTDSAKASRSKPITADMLHMSLAKMDAETGNRVTCRRVGGLVLIDGFVDLAILAETLNSELAK